MVKILVDCTCIRNKPSGVAYYTYNLIKALQTTISPSSGTIEVYRQPSFSHWLKRDNSLPPLLEKDFSPLTVNLPVTVSNFLGKSSGWLTKCDRTFTDIDIIHGTDHYVYPFLSGKKVMTIHDLTFLKYPEYCSKIVQNYTKRIKKCLNWTDLIITFSESTKQDIIDFLGIEKNKIAITSEASRYNQDYLKDKKIERIKSKINYDFNYPYWLFVSTIEPRKNLINLIKAFNILKEKQKINHKLVLIGQKGWQYEAIFAEIENSPYRKEIYHLGYLKDEELAIFYQQAEVFIYPSFYEGFGLPIVEAMTLGAPVVTSSLSSMPEVAGNGAVYINPYDLNSIVNGIDQVINYQDFREKLILQGKEKAKSYSWERVAKETFKAYSSIC